MHTMDISQHFFLKFPVLNYLLKLELTGTGFVFYWLVAFLQLFFYGIFFVKSFHLHRYHYG